MENNSFLSQILAFHAVILLYFFNIDFCFVNFGTLIFSLSLTDAACDTIFGAKLWEGWWDRGGGDNILEFLRASIK